MDNEKQAAWKSQSDNPKEELQRVCSAGNHVWGDACSLTAIGGAGCSEVRTVSGSFHSGLWIALNTNMIKTSVRFGERFLECFGVDFLLKSCFFFQKVVEKDKCYSPLAKLLPAPDFFWGGGAWKLPGAHYTFKKIRHNSRNGKEYFRLLTMVCTTKPADAESNVTKKYISRNNI